MGMFLFFVGFIVQTVFGIIILVKAFKVSVGWGLAAMFIPFAGLVFVINNWQDTKKAFFGGIGGGVLMVMGAFAFATSPEVQEKMAQAEQHRLSREAATRANDASDSEEPRANYASAAAPAYEPPRSAYQPATYTPSYTPPPPPAPAVTDTKSVEDEWTRKPVYEQVYVDRDTNTFYTEKCRKRPENVYRIPKSVALMQGFAEAKCP